ncbi:AAA family ATPase [archaeon]|nr:AAA family ATPase [archaeon]
MHKIIAIVGMPGSGKTEASEVIVDNGFQFIRLGQLTLDEVKRQGLEPTEKNERVIRERLRRENGMAAYALLNFQKIDSLLEKGSVVVDGLYSWEEYMAFKEKYHEIKIIAIYASPEIRHERLEKRILDAEDTEMKKRRFAKEEATSRDRAEIENLNKGGPIAMADYTIVNESTLEDLRSEIEKVLKNI